MLEAESSKSKIKWEGTKKKWKNNKILHCKYLIIFEVKFLSYFQILARIAAATRPWTLVNPETLVLGQDLFGSLAAWGYSKRIRLYWA